MGEPQHNYYMARCLQLAKRGEGSVAPNPMVGAVLVHNDIIIGEGYHQKYGEAHAEVNCINNALQNASELISSSTLYVSLEPCAHFGKTPPCADLIIKNKIPKVVIACRDSFDEVNGRGIDKLKNAGIEVIEGVLKKEAIELNRRFFTFHKNKRPFIILKWAQTADEFMASDDDNRLMITNDITNRLVHKWRSEEAGILIGTNTAIADNPLLDNRNWFGKAPVKILIDPQLKCAEELKLFKEGERTIVMNRVKEAEEGNVNFVKINSENFLEELTEKLYEQNIQSILVEGGRHTLQSCIDEGLWDEARILANTKLTIGSGLPSPQLCNAEKIDEQIILNDRIEFFKNRNATSGLL